jgi:hypothetical protein
MIEFCYFPPTGAPQYLFDEVLELAFALTNRGIVDLAPKSHRWIDLAFSDDFGETKSRSLRFGFASQVPGRLGLMGFGGPGVYSTAVVATSENAEATSPHRLHWLWDGTPCKGLSAIWDVRRMRLSDILNSLRPQQNPATS